MEDKEKNQLGPAGRKSVRWQQNIPGKITLINDDLQENIGSQRSVIIYNISTGGLCVEVDKLDENIKDDVISGKIKFLLEISLPNEKEPIIAFARLVYLSKIINEKGDSTDKCLVGLKFTDLTTSSHDVISHFILKSYAQLPKREDSGFTLIELMLVVIVIGALVAMVMPRLVGRGEQARRVVAKADIQANIGTALKLYELDNGSFPTSGEGLKALMNKNSSAINWNGPYLEKEPKDPWGREYQYKSPGEHKSDYDLYSFGKDGQEGTPDDVSNWE